MGLPGYDLAVLSVLICLVLLWVINTFILVILYRKVSLWTRQSADDDSFDDDVSRGPSPLPLFGEDEELSETGNTVPVQMLSNNYIRRSLLMADQSSSSPEIASSNVYDEITNVMIPKRYLQSAAFGNYRQGSKKRKRLVGTNSTGNAAGVVTSKTSSKTSSQTTSYPSKAMHDVTLTLGEKQGVSAKSPEDGSTRASFVTFKPILRNSDNNAGTLEEVDEDGDGTQTYMNMDKLSPTSETAPAGEDLNTAEYVPMGSMPRMRIKLPAKAPKPSAEVVDEILTARRLTKQPCVIHRPSVRVSSESTTDANKGVTANSENIESKDVALQEKSSQSSVTPTNSNICQKINSTNCNMPNKADNSPSQITNNGECRKAQTKNDKSSGNNLATSALAASIALITSAVTRAVTPDRSRSSSRDDLTKVAMETNKSESNNVTDYVVCDKNDVSNNMVMSSARSQDDEMADDVNILELVHESDTDC